MRFQIMLFGIIIFGFCLGLLMIFYPWSTYYGNFYFSWRSTLTSYLLIAALVGVVSGAANVLFRNSIMSAAARSIICGIVLLCFIVLIAIVFGPGGLDIPGTRVRGIFFSEWKFMSFIGYIGVPISIFVVIYQLLVEWLTVR